jgi:hypothetical protein
LGLGMELGLLFNIMKGISILSFSIVGVFKIYSKLDVQCMVIAKKEQTQFLLPM